jgi:hypothetical protein
MLISMMQRIGLSGGVCVGGVVGGWRLRGASLTWVQGAGEVSRLSVAVVRMYSQGEPDGSCGEMHEMGLEVDQNQNQNRAASQQHVRFDEFRPQFTFPQPQRSYCVRGVKCDGAFPSPVR